jgi:hypothetical protein
MDGSHQRRPEAACFLRYSPFEGVDRQRVPALTVDAPPPCGAPAGLILERLRCSARPTGAKRN